MKHISEYQDPTFSLQEAIRKQVEREDLLSWAHAPTPPHIIVPPLQPQAWSEAAHHIFNKQMFKRMVSLLTP